METKEFSKKIAVLVFIVFAFFLFSAKARAEIIIKKPADLYNLGDKLAVDFTIIEEKGGEAKISVFLVCNENEFLFFVSPVFSERKVEKSFSIQSFTLQKEFLGTCFLKAILENEIIEQGKSQFFKVSDKINISVSLNQEHFLPGERVEIKGRALKENGQAVNGIAKITGIGLISVSVAITNADFSVSLDLPSDLAAGERLLRISASEEGNKGETNVLIYLKSAPKKLEILAETPLDPPDTAKIKTLLYDQGGQLIRDKVSLVIKNPQGGEMNAVVQSGEEFNFTLTGNAPNGDWSVEARSGQLYQKKFIYVNKNEAIDVGLNGDTLSVKNTGNVSYEKPLEITIPELDKKIVKELSLPAGQETSFKLQAPDGVYSVKIDDKEFSSVPLKGKEAGVVEIKETLPFNVWYLLTPLGVIILLIIIIYLRTRKEFKKVAEITEEQVIKTQEVEEERDAIREEKDKIKELFERYVDESVVRKLIEEPDLRGEKREITALFVDIRNFVSLTQKFGEEKVLSLLNDYFEIASKNVYSYEGVINHIAGDEVFAIFNAPLEQENHCLAAVKAAIGIRDDIKNFNESLAEEEIEFNVGIGINSGEAVIGSIGSDKILKYTPIGDAINIASRIEKKAESGEILISRAVYEKIADSVAVQSIGIVKLKGVKEPVELFKI